MNHVPHIMAAVNATMIAGKPVRLFKNSMES